VVTGPDPLAVTHQRLPPSRRSASATTWWGKAWVRAVEEWAFAERDLRTGRGLARQGAVGAITVAPGSVVAAVEADRELWAVRLTVPVLADHDRTALVEVVAAESGRVAQLLDHQLPLSLAEDLEEAGVELLPYGGELGGDCPCPEWADPCPHALAVAHALARLLDADPMVLLHLRGLPRELLLAEVHGRTATGEGDEAPGEGDGELATALDAAARAARMLELIESDAAEGALDHLW